MFDSTFYYLCVFGVCSTWHLSFIHSTFITVCYDALIEFVLGNGFSLNNFHTCITLLMRLIHIGSLLFFCVLYSSNIDVALANFLQHIIQVWSNPPEIHCKVWTITDYHIAIISINALLCIMSYNNIYLLFMWCHLI